MAHENKSYDLHRYMGLMMCTSGCLDSLLHLCLFNAMYIVLKVLQFEIETLHLR